MSRLAHVISFGYLLLASRRVVSCLAMSYPIPVALGYGDPEPVLLEPVALELVALEPAVSGAPEPDALETAALELAETKTLRIGSEKYAYVYTQIARGTYRCSRGSDRGQPGEVLWLRQLEGVWFASDAHPDTPIEHVDQFSSNEDILSPGWHSWRMLAEGGREGQFETTVL